VTTADAQHLRRDVVLVSGMPGAGKSTLAGPLAAELGFALLSKDRIKETLHDVLSGALRAPGTPADLPWTRSLGAAAMELIWLLAGQATQVVLEANFRPRSSHERDKITLLAAGGGRLVEVYCRCPAQVAAARYAARVAHRHPVHVVTSLSAEFIAEFDQPVGLGELIEVNTLAQADIAALAGDVRARLAVAGGGCR